MADNITSKERVMVAFEHEEPDRVPAWLGASPEFRALMIERLDLEDDEALSVYLDDDFRRVYARYIGPDEFSPDKNLLPSATYRTPFGVERTRYGMPIAHPLKKATLREIHAYPWPDPGWMDPSSIRSDAGQWGGQYAILGGDWSPFWHDGIDLMGMDTLFYRMYDEPEVVDTLLGRIIAYYFGTSLSIFDAAADAIDIFFIGNDLAVKSAR